jgi:hypothetical protein
MFMPTGGPRRNAAAGWHRIQYINRNCCLLTDRFSGEAQPAANGHPWLGAQNARDV